MPHCGTQMTICDLPIRFDTYKGCSHACKYCFVQRKKSIAEVETGEGVEALKNFINGKRTNETKWCDWDIPLHWGGTSDPFQPAEKEYRRSYDCLKAFAATRYPFIVSTKGALIGDDDYIDLIRDCKCVIQISLVCPEYNVLERGAPEFSARLKLIEKLAKYQRVIVRIQPYMPEVHHSIMKSILLFAGAGAHGIIVEGMKFARRKEGLVKVGADYCYKVPILKKRYEEMKEAAHDIGMKFYCGENRLRSMGDSITCCGVDGLEGFHVNRCNINHYVLGGFEEPTEKMKETGTGYCFKSFDQKAGIYDYYIQSTFANNMIQAINKIKKDGSPVQ